MVSLDVMSTEYSLLYIIYETIHLEIMLVDHEGMIWMNKLLLV